MTGYIECWATTPAGGYIAHLDRSQASPFRRFAVSRMRGADPGVGSLEYHRDNALVAATPTLFADGNLVWMKFNGRTLTWIVEERKAVLDDSENATDWIAVSGRGVKQLLADRTVWPTAFSESALDPTAWGPDAQWRRFVNRAAGEMLWDLISESNPRFATHLVRGTIETTGADGWTQDFRFDSLLDVVASVCASYGDVELDGLTFSYRNAPGTNRSASVIFEEGADILRVERQSSDRDTLSWIVAEGVGEGVLAKLAVAKDVAISRRREGYVDAKDAGNLPLVQLQANAALDEFKPVDSIALEVTEGRFEAFTDYDLWDLIHVIAPSRGIDESAVIVALYLVEGDDERIRVGIDLNSLRTEYLLRLEQGNRSTANSVGVRNRMPQGQLVPFSIADTVYFDEATPSITAFYIPDRVNVVIECKVAIDFDEYPMPVSAAASGGGATSGSSSAASSASGGSSTPTSGASSASSADSSGTLTSASGGASTSGGEGAHWHYAFEFAGDSPIGSRTAHNYSTYGSAAGVNLETGASGHDILTGAPAADHTHSTPNHSHTVAGHDHGIAHTHVVTIGGHDHGIAHTHSTPDHSHSLVLAATKEAYPDSHSATIKVFKLNGGTWDLIGGVWGMTDDAPELDLTAYVDGPGRWRFTLQSDASQPNSGRLGAHISGYVLGGIQSA